MSQTYQPEGAQAGETVTEGGFVSRADQNRAESQPQAPMGDREAGGEPDLKGERGAGVAPPPEPDPEDADIAADDVGASAMAEARAKSADDV